MESAQKLWSPDRAFRENAQLTSYLQWLQAKKGLEFQDYAALWAWSVAETADFWESIWQYFEVIAHHPYQSVLSGGQMPEVTWFEGATLNYAEHIFRHQTVDRPAIIFQNEQERRHISWETLTAQVVAIQQYLQQKGVGKGDRVVAYLPNIPEAMACFLAVNGLGAIWSCCSPDFGVDTVVERFSQIEPKLLIAADGYRYNGKAYDRLGAVEQLQAALPTLEGCLFLPYLERDRSLSGTDLWAAVQADSISDQLPIFVPVAFDHPIWVLYSSGTTGRPKAITHSSGGVLLEHLKYMAFHNDAKAGEHFFWFTTTGWMMWNFLQASMLVGAVPVVFDGSPGYPSMDVLWQMAEELPVHHFGTSAPYLVACMKEALQPKDKFDLSALRSVGSTGAPLPPEAFRWVYSSVGEHIWLCSMSGGTDVCTAFVGGNPFAAVYEGRIQCRALGCALYAYNEEGERVDRELGEMVIEKPMPSMPIYFWNDPGKKRYRDSYFSDFPGLWRHGDWIQLFEDGSLLIQGRSDATLNRKGIRIGTAEIYRVLDTFPALRDSLILNLEQPDGSDIMPLFVALAEGESLTEVLIKAINTALRSQCSPRHVPDMILLAPDIPYTLSGKKMEVPVKKILLGMDVSKSLQRDAIRNPAAMDWFIEKGRALLAGQA